MDIEEFLIPPSSNNNDDLYTQIIKNNLRNRVLVINEEISDCVVENYILHIFEWNRQDKDLPVKSRKPITIYMNSVGGNSFDGFALVDAILMSKTPVIGVGLGLTASMGYHIYLACHKRYAFINSVFLQHDGEIAVQNSTSKARDTMAFFEDMENRTKEYVLERTTMSEEFYDKVYDQEYWFYADEGKDLGVVHSIIGVDCTLDKIL